VRIPSNEPKHSKINAFLFKRRNDEQKQRSQLAMSRDILHSPEWECLCPTPRLPMFAEDFEEQIEELHERDPDRYIDRNFQPATRLLRPTQ
jgi:hypothetical protein